MENNGHNQNTIMQWISFVVITGLFIASAVTAILREKETDRILAALFLIIVGFAWGANIWKFIAGRIIGK